MSERRVTLIAVTLVLVGSISMALYTPAMPEITRAFKTSEGVAQLTLSFYFGGFALTQLISGPLSDAFGRRATTIGFMGVYLLGSALALFAPSIGTLIAARCIQGVGAASGVAISRAMIRDLFQGETSIRLMNMMGVFLAIGPALAPAIGGAALELFGWRSLFLLMVLLGATILAVAICLMKETGTYDPSRMRPGAVAASYRSLLSSPYFVLSSFTIAGCVAAFYTMATILPFVLMEQVGLTPTAFGFGMLMQAGSFFVGALCVRTLIRRAGSDRLVPFGLVLLVASSLTLMLFSASGVPPTFLSVMGPVAGYSFGAAFVMPGMLTASMAPFPNMAGAASSMTGFLQMGGGLVGSSIAALLPDPALALATVIPAMGLISALSWLAWRRLSHP